MRASNKGKLGQPSPKLVNLWLDPKSTTAYSLWEAESEANLEQAFATLEHIASECVQVQPLQ